MTCAICGKPRTNSESDPHGMFGNHEYQPKEDTPKPSIRYLPNLIQRSDEWHAQRRGMVTASVVGSLITTRRLTAIDYDCPKCDAIANDPCCSLRGDRSPIKTLHPERVKHAKNQPSPIVIEPASNDTSRDLTALLVAERITGCTEPVFVNDDMQHGIDDEPIARAKYAEHYAPVEQVGLIVRDFGGFRLGYSPDGLVGEDGLIEIKSRRAKTQISTIISDTVPIDNMAQLQAGLLVSGREWIDYVSYHGGLPLFVKRVRPDRRWFDAITKAVAAFEDNAAEMRRLYDDAAARLHPTERIEVIDLIGL